MSQYGWSTISLQISIDLLAWSHIAPALFGIIFSLFLYRQTKKLSAVYLLLLSFSFALWSYLDLVTWVGRSTEIMYTWSIMDIFAGLFTIFAYWFLYTFINGKDVPVVHKVVSMLFLVPIFLYVILGLNFDTYYAPEQIADEASAILFYLPTMQTLFLLAIIVSTIRARHNTSDITLRRKALFGGIGTGLFVSAFIVFFLIANVYLYLDTDDFQVYNITVYSLFGMPFLMGFLGYLVAKYQAFDLKLTKSIGLVVVLILLLFINIFI